MELFADFLLPCTVFQFVFLYTGYAICLSCFVAVLFWTVMNLFEHISTAVVLLSVFVWLSYVWYIMNGNSKFVFLKYCNLISCLIPLDLIREYLLVNVAGFLVNIPILTLAVCSVATVVFTGIVLLRIRKPYASDKTNPVICFLSGIRKRIFIQISLTPSLWEHMKLLTEGKTVLAFVAAIAFGFSYQVPTFYLKSDEVIKQAYYQQLTSMSPEEVTPMLSEGLHSAEEKMRQLLQKMETNTQVDPVFTQMMEQYSMQCNVLNILLTEAEEMKDHNEEHKHKAIFFDSYQADTLFGMNEQTAGKWRMLGMILLVIYISAVCFPLEKQDNTISLIISSRTGIVRISQKKIVSVWLEVFLVVLCFVIPEGIKLVEISPVNAAVQSIPSLKDSIFDLPIIEYWLLLWGCRLLILLGVSSVVMLLSFLFRTVFSGAVMSEGIFGIPNILPVLFPAGKIRFLPISLISSYQLFTVESIVICGVSAFFIILVFVLSNNRNYSV